MMEYCQALGLLLLLAFFFSVRYCFERYKLLLLLLLRCTAQAELIKTKPTKSERERETEKNCQHGLSHVTFRIMSL